MENNLEYSGEGSSSDEEELVFSTHGTSIEDAYGEDADDMPDFDLFDDKDE